jgi:rSAM/selenodomain-associated transferase 1
MKTKKQKTALIIFAKEPKVGRVKTRLAKTLPDLYVLDLYKAFVKDVLTMALSVKCDEKFIFYSGSGHSLKFLKSFEKGFVLKRQMGSDLGERMYNAFRRCEEKGFTKSIIIGTDCLSIRASTISTALKSLDQADCVLGPTFDGGYYLIGLKESLKLYFKNITWSSESVLLKTLSNAKKSKKYVKLLSKKEDIDELPSLKKLLRQSSIKTRIPKTYQILQKIPKNSLK